MEEIETALAKAETEDEKADPALKTERTGKRRASRNESLDHLPHEEVVVEPESKACPCCGGELHVIGEDTSKRLDKVPAQVRVIVTRRPKYACRNCENTGAGEVAGIIQAPAPARLIEGGLPTEAMVAHVLVGKYADHLPALPAEPDPRPARRSSSIARPWPTGSGPPLPSSRPCMSACSST